MAESKVIIGLVGESGSGKDTVAKYLTEKYGALTMRFSDPIKESLNLFFDKSSKEDQQWMFLEFQQRFGRDVLHRVLRRKIEKAQGIIVVNGLRMPQDLDFIRGFENNFVIYVTVDQKLRWERSLVRGEKSDDAASFKKFQELEKAETEIHIPEIGAQADFTIQNEKDLAHLMRSVDEIIEKIK